MKLIAGFAALVAAAPAVTNCNAGTDGAAAMSMTIAEGDVQQAPDGWTLAGGVYSKTVAASTDNTAMGDTPNVKELVMTHTVSSDGCEDVDIGGVVVCKAIGHEIVFTCKYPMDDKILTNEEDFSVSGSDTEKTATGTGTLDYTLTVDAATFAIGEPVTATITPVTSGLVHATIESCSVTHKGNSQVVNLVEDNMQRECALGVDVTTGQGNGALSFTWNSFKWSTTLNEAKDADSSPAEDQEVSCSISLSKTAPAQQTQNVCASGTGNVPVEVWSVLLAGQRCSQNHSLLNVADLEECKTLCSSSTNCDVFSYGEITTGIGAGNWCFRSTANECIAKSVDAAYNIYSNE